MDPILETNHYDLKEPGSYLKYHRRTYSSPYDEHHFVEFVEPPVASHFCTTEFSQPHFETLPSPGQIIFDDIGDSELVESLSWSQSDIEREIEAWDQRLKEDEDIIRFENLEEVYLPRRPASVGSKYRQSRRKREKSRRERQLLIPKTRREFGTDMRTDDRIFQRDVEIAEPSYKQEHGAYHKESNVSRGEMTFYQQSSTPSSLSPTSGKFVMSSKHWLMLFMVIMLGGLVGVVLPYAIKANEDSAFKERLQTATALLKQVPLIDGHNDLPWNIRKFLHNRLKDFKFREDLRQVSPWSKSAWSHTDLPRLKAGLISAQFWAAYVPCEAQFKDAVQIAFEQVDVIRRFTDRFNPELTLCTSSKDIVMAHKKSQLCSLIGVEGGHALASSLAILRTLYEIGVRYLTLTSTCNTPWADSSRTDHQPGNKSGTIGGGGSGLSNFGRSIVREMNRLGMLVDLSHVSEATMLAALNITKAPVIFSHSATYALCNSTRNVPDHVLLKLAENDGVIMINFFSQFLTCKNSASIDDAIAHIEHVRNVAGINHIGLGAGFDGINITPNRLDDVSTYPVLFAELLAAGWSEEELQKLAGLNFLRVMRRVEQIRDELREAGTVPSEDMIAPRFLNQHSACITKNLF